MAVERIGWTRDRPSRRASQLEQSLNAAARNGNGNGNGNGHGRRGAVSQLLAALSTASAARQASRASRAAWSEWTDLRHELNRSRRYERCFTILRIALPAADGSRRWRGRASTAAGSAHAIAPLVRSVDGVWTDDADVYVLLPECDRTNGERTLERIEVSLVEALPSGSSITLATFPHDGRTSGALLNALHGRPVETIEAPAEAPALSLVEEIVRTVASPLAGAEGLRELPHDGAEAPVT